MRAQLERASRLTLMYRVDVLNARPEDTPIAREPAPPFSGGGDRPIAILGVERHMDVTRGAIHVAPALSPDPRTQF